MDLVRDTLQNRLRPIFPGFAGFEADQPHGKTRAPEELFLIFLIRHCPARKPLAATLALGLALFWAGAGAAQTSDGVAVVDPRLFGFEIAPGSVTPGLRQSVLTRDESGEPVVGRLHVKVGEAGIVLLPDGQLVARPPSMMSTTERRFEPASINDLAERFTAGRFPDFRVKKTRHYLYVHDTSEQFALATSRILESMLKGMLAHARTQQIKVSDPEVPLVAIMFHARSDFDAFRAMPAGVLAYYDPVSNLIVLHEESPFADVKSELALQQSISTIAHEGAHQILHNIGVQARLSIWPLWLSEGLAEYYAPTTFGRQFRWKGAGHVNDLRMFELELYLKGRDVGVPRGSIIEQTIQAGRLTSTGYASAWSLTHYLAKNQRKAFHRYIQEISDLGPFESLGDVREDGIVPANLRHFQEHFDLASNNLEDKVVGHLRQLPYRDPFAEWPHFVAAFSLQVRGRFNRDANLFHTRDLAEKWIAEQRQRAPADSQTTARSWIRVFPNRLLAEQFARGWIDRG